MFGSISPSFSQQPAATSGPRSHGQASKDDLLQVQLLSYLRGATDAPAHVPWTSLGPWRNGGTAGWNCSENGEMTLFCLEDTEQKSCWSKIPCEKKTQSVLLVMYNLKYILFAGKKRGLHLQARKEFVRVCVCDSLFLCKQLVNGGLNYQSGGLYGLHELSSTLFFPSMDLDG